MLKPKKPPNELTSYQPISLLPIESKVSGKLLLRRLLPMVENNRLIPNHQFGFTLRHSTIEPQIVRRINEVLETAILFCSNFRHLSSARQSMAYWTSVQIKAVSPLNYFLILKSYLHSRHFPVKVETEYTELSQVNVGVLQGGVLGPLLYLLYSADLLTSPESTTETFTDDTALVATDSDPAIASQPRTDFKKWRIKANGSKSTHVTFTT
jgi:hypothetical protein